MRQCNEEDLIIYFMIALLVVYALVSVFKGGA